MASLHRKRLLRYGDDIKAIRDAGKDAAQQKIDVDSFEGMYLTLEFSFGCFIKEWESLEELIEGDASLGTDNDAGYVATIKRYRQECNTFHLRFKREKTASSAARNETTLTSVTVKRPTLPTIDIPKFDGNIIEWPAFKAIYEAMVHQSLELSDAEKFQYLRHFLRGEALGVVKPITFDGSHYAHAWDEIMSRYDQKRKLSQAYIMKILSFRPITSSNTTRQLSDFLAEVGESVQAFKKMKIEDPEEYIFFELGVRNLEPQMRERFERQHTSTNFPKFTQLAEFIKEEIRTLENIQSPTKIKKSQVTLLTMNKSTQGERKRSESCSVCSKDHRLFHCAEFNKSSVSQRWKLLKERQFRGCKNCLNPHHNTSQCKSQYSCKKCGRRHHTSLHGLGNNVASNGDEGKASETRTSANPPKEIVSCIAPQCASTLLATVVVDIQGDDHVFRCARGIIDSASQGSLITSDCAQRLRLHPRKTNTVLRGLGNKESVASKEVEVTIRSRHFPSFVVNTTAIVVPVICPKLPQATVPPNVLQRCSQLFLADENFGVPEVIDLVLGVEIIGSIITGAPITLGPNFPVVLPTVFGSAIVGSYKDSNTKTELRTLISTAEPAKGETEEDVTVLSKFWELEEVSNPIPIFSREEEDAEQQFLATVKRVDGRLMVSYPFKREFNELGQSKQQAIKRLFALETRLQRSPQLKAAYIEFMKEYQELGHMEVARTEGKYFIPHHPVVKMKGGTMKIRVVFDGGASTSNGSLNSYMHKGCNLLNDIQAILLMFRIHKIALVTDIVKMFRQVLINPEQRIIQHILWRRSPTDCVTEYELTTVTYGLRAAPYVSARAIKKLMEDDGDSYPLAKRILEDGMYVDDIIGGASDIESAKQLKSQLINFFKGAGMELSKWSSNKRELLQDNDPETNAIEFSEEGDNTIKVLGLQWEPRKDIFCYYINPPKRDVTKRNVLSSVASLFDPLGFLAPVVLRAKSIFQNTWQCQIGWDEPLPNNLRRKWLKFEEELPKLSTISLPRYLPTDSAEETMAVGFCDASQIGYCAVFYIRIMQEGNVNSFLLKAKTKVCPIKPITMNRLELCSAVLLVKLFKSLQMYLQRCNGIKARFFTDSMTVMHWLHTDPSRLKQFVANRIISILEGSNVDQWAYIASNHNPADIGSRGCLPVELKNHTLWWMGPPWINNSADSWPLTSIVRPVDDIPEIKRISNIILNVKVDEFSSFLMSWIERFSNYKRLMRSFSYVLRIVRRNFLPAIQINAEEFESANEECIRLVQQYFFKEKEGQKHLFSSLNVFKDENGFLRVGGRVRRADIDFSHKHPILLPRGAHFTKLLVRHFHYNHKHLGCNALQSIIQLQYWVPGLRTLLRSERYKCKVCYRYKLKTVQQYMGDLPDHRFSQIRAFHKSGVDFAGPFTCKESQRRNARTYKVFLCLFVCLSTKALHLEVATDLSTPAFLDCYDRFVARRGLPSLMLSDCGTNFVGTNTYLKELMTWYNSDMTRQTIIERTAPNKTKWEFIPPASPNFGGIWEAGVKCVKTLLRKITEDHSYTYPELITIFARIEAILNSRPLTPLSNDPNDLEALTPGHFLVGAPMTALPERNYTELPENRVSRWQLLRRITQQFWQRWRTEYLHTLQQRTKWTKKSNTPLKTDDLVLLRVASAEPLHWPLGRVLKVHPGDDGIIRVVTLRTSTGTFKRPVSALAPLQKN